MSMMVLLVVGRAGGSIGELLTRGATLELRLLGFRPIVVGPHPRTEGRKCVAAQDVQSSVVAD